MKTIEKAIVLSLVLGILFNVTSFKGKCESINDKVFRLHILANSDSQEDQDLKLKVRDRVLEYSKEYLNIAEDKISAEKLSEKNLKNIKELAENEIKKQGYNYPVKIEICNMYFNTRQYGNITLPAGKYDALRILIGEGKGHNWWCVMFPPICLGAVKEEKPLDTVLNENEIELVSSGEKYEMKFKIVEWYEMFKNWIYGFWE